MLAIAIVCKAREKLSRKQNNSVKTCYVLMYRTEYTINIMGPGIFNMQEEM